MIPLEPHLPAALVKGILLLLIIYLPQKRKLLQIGSRGCPEKRTFRAWYLVVNPQGLPETFVQKELEFQWKLFANRPKERE